MKTGVILARVDERLIHGQVANAWLKKYPVDVVIVVDDESANDNLRKTLLEMAVIGTSAKCVVTTEADAVETVKKYANSKIFLCAKSPAVFLKMLQEGVEIPEVNIGGIYAQEGRKQYFTSVFLDEKTKEDILALGEFPCKVDYRMVPQDQEVDIIKQLK